MPRWRKAPMCRSMRSNISTVQQSSGRHSHQLDDKKMDGPMALKARGDVSCVYYKRPSPLRLESVIAYVSGATIHTSGTGHPAAARKKESIRFLFALRALAIVAIFVPWPPAPLVGAAQFPFEPRTWLSSSGLSRPRNSSRSSNERSAEPPAFMFGRWRRRTLRPMLATTSIPSDFNSALQSTATAAKDMDSFTSPKVPGRISEIDIPTRPPSLEGTTQVDRSVHLQLGSITTNDTEDDAVKPAKKKDKKDKRKTAKMHTYRSLDANSTLYGLDVSFKKFKAWANHTVMASDPHATFDSDCISTEEVRIDDDDVRDELRVLWRSRQLLSQNTQVLSVYKSDRDRQLKRKAMQTDSNHGECESSSSSSKRGGFPDLLASHADRIVGIVTDEREDANLTGTPTASALFDGGKRLVEGNCMKEQKLFEASSAYLMGWIERLYGSSNSHELKANALLRRPEKEIFSVLQNFMDWFRSYFPYYYDRCAACGASAKDDAHHSANTVEIESDTTNSAEAENEALVQAEIDNDSSDAEQELSDKTMREDDDDNGTFIGYVYPSDTELLGKATRTELYQCHRCGSFTRFPRYNKASWILKERRGRCGEYSMLLFRLLRAAGHKVRWVVDWADHVWVEIWIGNRWVHLDPCEAVIDEPLLYEAWGKKQTYIMAFNAPTALESFGGSGRERVMGSFRNQLQYSFKPPYSSISIPFVSRKETPLVEDVTQKYTSDSKGDIDQRRDESNEVVQSSLERVEHNLRDTWCRIFTGKDKD